MNIAEYHISPDEININERIIAKLLSIDVDSIPEPYDAIIDKELKMIPTYGQIAGGLRIVESPELDMENNVLILDKIRFNIGNQVIRHLGDSEKMVLFACTAGDEVSKRSKELMKSGQMLEGYICDVIGSVLVEEAMSIIHNRFIEELSKTGLSSTNRYSPGYCDWNVDEQHKLFSFFPPGFCGIELSESALMHPIKSVSGVFGIGKNVQFHKYVCNACSNVNCIYRNLKYTI